MEKKRLMQTIVATQSERLDKLLKKSLDVSRNQIEQLIKKGYVSVNGNVVCKAGFKVQSNDCIEYSLPKVEKRDCEIVNWHSKADSSKDEEISILALVPE